MKIKTIRILIILTAISLSISCAHPLVSLPEGTYYVDSLNGNDDAAGLSPSTAWRTLEKLSYTVVAPGSTVLLKSGEIFRGSLVPSSGNSAKLVFYGSYGGDEKAIIQNSIDLGNAADWKESEAGIWKAQTALKLDVGNIIFNGTDCAVRKWSRSELNLQGDYFFDRFWKTLRVRSSENPASFYSSVEAALTEHIIDQSNLSYASFNNLHLRYGGAHGFGGGGTKGLSIDNCEFSYIGGGFLFEKDGEPVRYGNGVEFWGNASNNIVENCYFHDIYDTGVTNQNHTSTAVQTNITYRNNIIENCGLASFEFWNRPAASSMSNILFENNTSVNPGEGWGAQRPDLHGSHVTVFSNESQLDNIIIRNNIFYGGNMIYFLDQGTYKATEVAADYNCLYPVEDSAYDYLCVVWDNISLASSLKYRSGELEAFRVSSGRETNSINTDPQFNIAKFPYTLSILSPCPNWGAVNF